MKKLFFASAIAIAGLMLTMEESRADRFRISYRSGCASGYYGGGYARRSVYSYPRVSVRGYYNSGYRGGVHRSWHDTSHYDYHPATAVRHRNHYHVIPGHYDYHRTGHWDYHH